MDISNPTYFNNRNFLKQIQPSVFNACEALLKEEEKADDGFEYEFFNGKKGDLTVLVKSPDGREVHAHSIYDPIREWERRFENVEFTEEDRIVLVGFGLGYHIEYLLNKAPKSTIVVIEPFIRLFDEVLKRRNLMGILSNARVIIALGTTPEYISFATGQGVSPLRMPNFRLYSLPYVALMPEMNDTISTAIANIRENMLFNFYTGLFAGDKFFQNTVDNFPVAIRNPGICSLRNRFSKKPAFVIAPGPSLEKNVEQLHRVKGNALIIAVDTATKPLQLHGIMPDMIVTLDYQTKNHEKLKGVDTSSAYLVPAIEVCPEIPRDHKGKAFTYYHSPTTAALYDPILGDRGILGSGGSVLTDAFNLAFYTGADPIIFVGVDLGFPGKRWYADGSFEGGRFTKDINDGKIELIEIEDVYGNPMYTYRSFHAFLKYFNSFIPTLPIKVIDATEGGAKIDGTVIMNLSDAIDEHLTDPYKSMECLDNIHSEYKAPDKDELITKVDENTAKYKELARICRKGIEECEKSMRLIKKKRFDSTLVTRLKKINDYQGRIKDEGKYIDFISAGLEFMMLKVFSFEENKEDPRDVKYRRVVEVSRESFEHLRKAMKYVHVHFEEIADKIRKEII